MSKRVDTRPRWWISTVCQILGATMLASNWVPPFLCYLVMFPGSMAGTSAAYHDRNTALVYLNSFFTLINLVGLWRWW